MPPKPRRRRHINTRTVAETVECEAWLDFFAACPPDVRADLGLTSGRTGAIGLLASRAVPIVELNRAIVPTSGMLPPASALDAVAGWLDQHAAAGWSLQIEPSRHNVELLELLNDRTVRAGRNLWECRGTLTYIVRQAELKSAAPR